MRGERRDQATPTPTSAAMTATCIRPVIPTANHTPAHHQRSRGSAQTAPQIPSRVTGCVHRALALTDHTGEARPNTAVAPSASGREAPARLRPRNISATAAAVSTAAAIPPRWKLQSRCLSEEPR